MDYKNNSNTGLIIVADCMLLSVEYIGNVHLFFNRFKYASITAKHRLIGGVLVSVWERLHQPKTKN